MADSAIILRDAGKAVVGDEYNLDHLIPNLLAFVHVSNELNN